MSIKKIKGKAVVKTKALYNYEKNRKVNVKGTRFMKNAAMKTRDKIDDFYIKEAKRQIARLM